MDLPKDEDPEILEDLVYRAQIALADARAKAAGCEYELSRVKRDHPDVAVRNPRLEECTVGDFRPDDLKDALQKINAGLGLGLTGEEPDYWRKLVAYAQEHLGLSGDDFQDMTREKLAGLIQEHLDGPKGIPISERTPLLESYKSVRPNSDRAIYRAENFPADSKAFKTWKSGKLPRKSQQAINIERFLQNREVPKKVKPPTT